MTVPALLRERTFRRYWSAQTISMFGDQISSIALPLTAVLVLRASAADMGYLTAARSRSASSTRSHSAPGR